MATALITGASSGIGLELAKQFAGHNHNVILVARSEDKLNELVQQLSSNQKIKTWALVKDLSNEKQVDEVFSFTQSNDIQVEFLINNAGFGDFGDFDKTDWQRQNAMLDTNIKALTRLSWLYAREMVKIKSGRIMNVASTAAFQPVPLMSVYAATKSYVLSFSEAMANELKDKGVTVTALCPGATATGFADAANMRNSKLFKNVTVSSQEVASYGYKAMMKGKTVAIPGIMNYMMASTVVLFPRKIVTKIARSIQE